MEFKHLKQKDEFKPVAPSSDILEVFKNPGVSVVRFECNEVTSLCPVTGQPDFAKVDIYYYPNEYCIESKSLKLYLFSYRNQPCFAEQMAYNIARDVMETAQIYSGRVSVMVTFKSRGGIIINATSTGGKDD